jgi:hypothetical protein
VRSATLIEGDEIQVGHTRFKFIREAPAGPQGS